MSAGWSRRSSFRRAGVAVGLALVLVACSADEPEAGRAPSVAVSDTIPAPDPESRPDPVTRPSSDIRPAIEPDEPTVVVVEETPDATILGDVEVAVVQRLPRLELRWADAELDVPQDLNTNFGFMFAGFVGDEIVIVGQSSPQSGPPTLSTWRSTDGATWDRADQLLQSAAWIHAVFARDDQLVAVGQGHDAEGPELVLLGTDADARWQPIDLGEGIDPVGLSSWMHASNGAGVVLVAERFDPIAHGLVPLTIVIWDHELVLDENAGTYSLIDRRSGEVTSSGLTSEIYPWNEDGQAVWNLETRELLTVVPWDVWGDAWASGPPLPIPVPGSDATVPTVEWDGYRIVFDDANGHVDVFDLDTEEPIQSVSSEEFHRGPQPQFHDDDTGELVWSPTWDEWDQLVQAAYEAHYEQMADASSAMEPQRVLLVSQNGSEWTEIELDVGDVTDSFVESLWSVAGEYQLVANEYGAGEPVRRLYRSPDGIEWTATDIDPEQMMQWPTAGPNGVVVVSTPGMGGYDSPMLKTSVDGITWTPAFQLGEQDDGRHAWFELLASGSGGHGALATLVPRDEAETLTITLDGRTAEFGYGETAVTITDENGDALLEASWQELELAMRGEREPIATYDDGVTTFWSPDGSPLMRIPDEAVGAEYERRHEANIDRTDRVLFLERLGTWYEVQVPTTGDEAVQLLAIGDDMVVVAAGQWGYPGFECCEGEMDGGMASLRVLVGDLDAAR